MDLTVVVLVFCAFGQASAGVSTPAEMVAEAIAPLPQGKLYGQPLTLLAAVSSATDRRQQLEVTHAYWRLVEAAAGYHSALDYDNRLKQLQPEAGQAGLLRAAWASSAAMLQEAEVAAVAAQHELAAAVSLPPDAILPLPADRPHVGKYLTGFDQLFLLGSPPVRARLIDRTLPIRYQAIQQRAMAVRAAEAARAAEVDALGLGQTDLPAVLASMAEGLRQRRALMASVRRYNDDIADYALATAAPAIDARALVAMLIKPSEDSAVRRAGHFEPVPTPAWRPGGNVPTPAKRPEKIDRNVPTPAKRPEKVDQNMPTPAKRPVVPVVVEPEGAVPTTANKPVTAGRAKQLTLALHRDRTLPGAFGEPLGLEECLRSRSGGERRGLIKTYWLLRQRAAEYLLLAEQVKLFEDLSGRDDEQPGALRLHSARTAAEAALREAHIGLLEAQFALATRIGRVSYPAWPTASTIPHAGRYLLKLEAQPRQLVESWPLRRLAAVIPGLAGSVRQRATAVVEAEAARAAATASYRSGGQSIERVLDSIDRQTAETLAFLQAVTDYNCEIAEYALTVLPPNTPSEKLMAALVVVP